MWRKWQILPCSLLYFLTETFFACYWCQLPDFPDKIDLIQNKPKAVPDFIYTLRYLFVGDEIFINEHRSRKYKCPGVMIMYRKGYLVFITDVHPPFFNQRVVLIGNVTNNTVTVNAFANTASMLCGGSEKSKKNKDYVFGKKNNGNEDKFNKAFPDILR